MGLPCWRHICTRSWMMYRFVKIYIRIHVTCKSMKTFKRNSILFTLLPPPTPRSVLPRTRVVNGLTTMACKSTPLPHPLPPSSFQGFVEVEDTLREITQREATWGGMLSNGAGTPAHASTSDRSNNGIGVGDVGASASSLNGRAAAASGSGGKGGLKRASRRGESLLAAVGGGGVTNGVGGGAGIEALAGTRTLV